MKLGQVIADFLANPFDPNKDGKTSAAELFAALGLVAVASFVWSQVINNSFD